MIAISTTLRNAFNNEAYQYARLTVTPTTGTAFTLTNSDIVLGTLTIDRQIAMNGSITLGDCSSAELTVTINNSNGTYNSVVWNGASIDVEIGAEVSGVVSYIHMGIFYVDTTPKVRDSITLTALDGMCKFDKVMESGTWVTANTTIGNVVTKCCSECGVTLATTISGFPNYSYKIGVSLEGNTTTWRQLLMDALGAMGKCGWMNEQGQLEIGFPVKNPSSSAIAETLDTSTRFSSDYEDYPIEITGLAYVDEASETDASGNKTVHIYGTDDYTFNLTGNPLIAKSPYNVLYALRGLVGLTYTPFSATTIPYPYLMPLDWIAYEKEDSTTIKGICTAVTFTLNGGCGIKSVGLSPTEKSNQLMDSVGNRISHATGETLNIVAQEYVKTVSLDAEVARLGYVNIDDLNADVAQLGYLTANSATITNIQADTAKIHDLTAQQISSTVGYIGTLTTNNVTASNLVADHSTVGSLSTNYAEIDFANVDTADITTAWIKDLMIQGQMVAQDGTIFWLTGLHIDANDITAGTMTVDRLQLLGTDGLYYYLNFNSMGKTVFEQLSEDDQLSCQSQIHANSIVSNSITTDQITTNNLVGTGGWINLASGTFEYANAETADGISWDGQHLTIRGSVTMTSGQTIESALSGLATTNSDLQDQIDDAVDSVAFITDPQAKAHYEQIASTFTFEGNTFKIETEGAEIHSEQGANFYKYVDTANNTVFSIDRSGTSGLQANVTGQIGIGSGNVEHYQEQWAIRKGSEVSGVGYNLDIVWVGGNT